MALSKPTAEFPLFQRMPFELQCMVWDNHPATPRILPVNAHTHPNSRWNRPAESALYGVQRFSLIPEEMRICQSAWFSYSLHYKCVRLVLDPIRPIIGLYSDPNHTNLLLNPTRDVLSHQYHLHLPPSQATTFAQGQNDRQGTMVVRVDRNVISNGPITVFPNLLRHLHIDLLPRFSSPPNSTSDPTVGAIDMANFFERMLSDPAKDFANLRTITFTVNDSPGPQRMFRLVAATPGLPNPHELGAGLEHYARLIRGIIVTGRGAILCRPAYIGAADVKEKYAFLRVILPGTTVRDDEGPLPREVRRWQLVLGSAFSWAFIGSMNPALRRSLPVRLRATIVPDGPSEIDGVCAPNYGMEEADVF